MIDEPDSSNLSGEEKHPEVLSSLPKRRPQRASKNRAKPTMERAPIVNVKKTGADRPKTSPRSQPSKDDEVSQTPAAMLSQAEGTVKGVVSTGLTLTTKAAGALFKRIRR